MHYDNIVWNTYHFREGNIGSCVLNRVAVEDDQKEILGESYKPWSGCTILREDLIVTRKNVLDFEVENNIKIVNGVRVLEVEESAKPELAPYLDAKRPDYPRELAAAINAWLYVVKLGPLPANFKKELREILRINGCKGEALERIATVANPHKDKGTPRRSE